MIKMLFTNALSSLLFSYCYLQNRYYPLISHIFPQTVVIIIHYIICWHVYRMSGDHHGCECVINKSASVPRGTEMTLRDGNAARNQSSLVIFLFTMYLINSQINVPFQLRSWLPWENKKNFLATFADVLLIPPIYRFPVRVNCAHVWCIEPENCEKLNEVNSWKSFLSTGSAGVIARK